MNERKQSFLRYLLYGFVLFMLGIVTDFLAGYITEDVLENPFTPTTIVVSIGLAVLGIVLIALWDSRSEQTADSTKPAPIDKSKVTRSKVKIRGQGTAIRESDVNRSDVDIDTRPNSDT